jgi:hypothetical protein
MVGQQDHPLAEHLAGPDAPRDLSQQSFGNAKMRGQFFRGRVIGKRQGHQRDPIRRMARCTSCSLKPKGLP